MARYGLRAKAVLDAVETDLGGKNVTTEIEGRQRFPIQCASSATPATISSACGTAWSLPRRAAASFIS